MITQEDYNFISQLDNSDPEQRAQLLKSKPYLVRPGGGCLWVMGRLGEGWGGGEVLSPLYDVCRMYISLEILLNLYHFEEQTTHPVRQSVLTDGRVLKSCLERPSVTRNHLSREKQSVLRGSQSETTCHETPTVSRDHLSPETTCLQRPVNNALRDVCF